MDYSKAVKNEKSNNEDDWSVVPELIPDKSDDMKDVAKKLVDIFKGCDVNASQTDEENENKVVNNVEKLLISLKNLIVNELSTPPIANNKTNDYKDKIEILVSQENHLTVKIDRCHYGHIIGRNGNAIKYLKEKIGKRTDIVIPQAGAPLDKHIEVRGEKKIEVLGFILEKIID